MTKVESELPISTLRSLVYLDSNTGALYWKKRSPDQFTGTAKKSAEYCANAWNGRFANKEALTAKGNGYKHGCINYKYFRAHRVVYALYHNKWPDYGIDHINGNPLDNRPCNLRDVPSIENSRNMKLSKRNKSGHTGVSYIKRERRWKAHVVVKGKALHIGQYATKNEAILARQNANLQYKFHENHGSAR